MSEFDLEAAMSNELETIEDMGILLDEIEDVRLAGQLEDRRFPVAQPQDLLQDVLDEIPRRDATYASLSTTLVPHSRIPGMHLLQYRTFAGAMAYQPCGKDIDISGIFLAINHLDHNGDHLFKTARAWSCVVQSIQNLPKDVRWVLATIYNFANEMLRPELNEDDLWEMRPWLMHWYDVADKLFALFGIFASAPLTDWFLRPTAVTPGVFEQNDDEALWSRCHTQSPVSSLDSPITDPSQARRRQIH